MSATPAPTVPVVVSTPLKPMIPKCPSPNIRVVYASDQHPLGMAGTSSFGKSVASCWVGAALSILANDPFISMFVNSIYNERGTQLDRLRKSVVQLVPVTVEDKYAIDIIEMIWLINNGAQERLASVGRAFFIEVLAHTIEQVNSEQSDSVQDGYLTFREQIKESMAKWWSATNPLANEMYITHGCRIHTVEIHSPLGSNWGPASTHHLHELRDDSPISITVDFAEMHGITDLSHYITHRHFNNMTYVDKLTSLTEKKGNEGVTRHTMIRRIVTLPWRFTVQVRRITYTMGNNTNKKNKPRMTDFRRVATALTYDPECLIIGPTVATSEWAKYRLVGRISHSGGDAGDSGHYTSDIRDGDTKISLDFDHVTRQPIDKSPMSDKNCVLLQFERYQ